MAFNLPSTDPATGVKATYWRLTGVFVDLASRRARLYFGGYTSKKARDAEGSQPVATRELIATGDAYDTHFGPLAKTNATVAAYAYAKGEQSILPTTPKEATAWDDDGRPTEFAHVTASPFADATDA